MDKFTIGLCVAALLLIVSHWVTFELGKHTGKATALRWASGLTNAILNKATDQP